MHTQACCYATQSTDVVPSEVGRLYLVMIQLQLPEVAKVSVVTGYPCRRSIHICRGNVRPIAFMTAEVHTISTIVSFSTITPNVRVTNFQTLDT